MVSTCAQFTVGDDHVVKEFPKLGKCWWAEDELDKDGIDQEPYTPEDVERGKVMYIVECGHIMHTQDVFTMYPNPLYHEYILPYTGAVLQNPLPCIFCRRDIRYSHVRLLPREAFRRQYYRVWYAMQTSRKKADMEAEWQSNQRALAPYGLQSLSPQDMANIIFPPKAIPPQREAAKEKVMAAAAAAGGALLGLFTTHSLYRHMVRSMR